MSNGRIDVLVNLEENKLHLTLADIQYRRKIFPILCYI